MNKLPLNLLAAAVFSTTANANINVTFREGAPKDRFTITNTGECAYEQLQVTIDLGESAGQLIFDTTERGDGVEVFQPFETSDGKLNLLGASEVRDGQTSLTISISGLAPSNSVSFTIDVDDTMTVSELGNIRVSQAEIEGAVVEVETLNDQLYRGTFGGNAKVDVVIPSC